VIKLQQYFNKRDNVINQKRKFILSLFLFIQYTYASNYSSTGYIEAYSDKLSFDIFDEKWEQLPNHNKSNNAFGTIYYDIAYKNNKYLKFGIFREQTLDIIINDGFIKTWYNSSNDFNTLLRKSNIKDDLDTINIYGYANMYDSDGLYLEKSININSNSMISLKTKFYHGKELQYLETKGYNNKNRFELDLDLYYSTQNIVTKNEDHDNNFNGYGYGFDIEYNYNVDKLDIYLSVLNIGAKIKWNSITHMYYKFDSQTVYTGEDGYDHAKAFGNGYYKYDTTYTQKLPLRYKADIKYRIFDNIYLGDSVIANNYSSFNEIYTKYLYANQQYKFGYFIENKLANFGFGYKNFIIEISNKFGSNNKLINLKYKISF